MDKIIEVLNRSIEVKQKILADHKLLETINQVAAEMIAAFNNKHKVFFCGNGGSASDAQHLAAELSGRFYLDREPLFAEALHVNTSFLTAIANDYSFDETYPRLIRAFGQAGDVLLGLSTSGNSRNVVKAIETANQSGIVTVGFTGEQGGRMKELCKYLIRVPSDDTPRIQEAHIVIGHIICEIVEAEIFNQKDKI